MKSATIEPITISDHAPVGVVFHPVFVGHQERTWLLNELDDRQIADDIQYKLEEYFKNNIAGGNI